MIDYIQFNNLSQQVVFNGVLQTMWANDLLDVGKPAEKLKLASSSSNIYNYVWIFHGPLMVKKVHGYYHLTEQFEAKGKLSFFKQHLDLKQHVPS